MPTLTEKHLLNAENRLEFGWTIPITHAHTEDGEGTKKKKCTSKTFLFPTRKMAQSNPANVIKFLHVIENLKVTGQSQLASVHVLIQLVENKTYWMAGQWHQRRRVNFRPHAPYGHHGHACKRPFHQ